MSCSAGDVLEGFISFVHVDTHGKPLAHGIVLEATTEKEKGLQKRAKELRKN